MAGFLIRQTDEGRDKSRNARLEGDPKHDRHQPDYASDGEVNASYQDYKCHSDGTQRKFKEEHQDERHQVIRVEELSLREKGKKGDRCQQ